jgi:hypothetical protein
MAYEVREGFLDDASHKSVIGKSLKPAPLNSIRNMLKTSTKPVWVNFDKYEGTDFCFDGMHVSLLYFLPFIYELLMQHLRNEDEKEIQMGVRWKNSYT